MDDLAFAMVACFKIHTGNQICHCINTLILFVTGWRQQDQAPVEGLVATKPSYIPGKIF
jgi:hypothetical protein